MKMKFFKFIFMLFLFTSIIFCYQNKIDDLIKYLEAGSFQKSKLLIEKESDLDLQKYMYSIYYLYLGDYLKANDYIKDISDSGKFKDQLFYIYIPYINEILTNGYKKYESEHFVVWLKGKDEILKDLILEKLEKIYQIYGEIFGYFPKDKITVEVYNNKQEFYFATTLGEDVVKKSGVVGICKFNKIMLLSPKNLPFGYRWVDTLAHECVHLILNRLTDYTFPLYLHEGTARYFDTLYRSTESLCFTPGNIKLLLDAKKNNKLVDFSEMRGSLVYFNDKQKIELSFVELASFIKYLIKQFGQEKYLDFVKNYKFFKDEKEIYKKVFNKEFEEILLSWRESLGEEERYLQDTPGAISDFKLIFSEAEDNLIDFEIEQYVSVGDKFLNMKDYKSALYHYGKAREKEFFNPIVMKRIAKVYFLTQKYKEAEEILKQCIDVNPNFVGSYEMLFKLYYEQSRYSEALELFKQILEINPFNYEIRKIAAEIYSDLGKIKNALEEYKVVRVLQPEKKELNDIIENLEKYLERKYNK